MKRFLSLILCAALILSCCPIIPLQASAATSGTCGENVSWTLDDAGTLTISGTGPMTDYLSNSNLPWYSDSSSIKSMIIESGVTTIGNHTFDSCSNLTSITIPDSVTAIGKYTFRQCDSLTTVTIPDSVTVIGEDAFYSCDSLTSVTIGDSVTTICDWAFAVCNNLDDVYYAGTAVQWQQISIGLHNTWLTNAKIHYNHIHDYSLRPPVTVQPTCTTAGYIEYTCIYGETHRDKFVSALGHECTVFLETVDPSCDIDGYTKMKCTRCEHTEKIDIVYAQGHSMVVVPAVEPTCTETGLTVGTICKHCQMVGIAQTVVPATHNYVDNVCTTCGAYSTETVAIKTLPSKLNYRRGEELDLAGLVLQVTRKNGSTGEITEGYTASGFDSTTTGTKTVTVTYEGKTASFDVTVFVDQGTCGENLTWTLDDEGTLTISGTGPMTNFTDGLPWGCMKKVIIESGVTTIGDRAFSGCDSLTSIAIPDSVTTIGDDAFHNCYYLTYVTIPDSVTYIGSFAFFSCSSLTSVTIGDSVKSINGFAFANCVSLTDVYFTGSQAQWDQITIGEENEALTNATLHTVEPTSGTCGENLTWTLDDAGTLTISGTGPMTDYLSNSDVPWYSDSSSIKNVIIESGVTTISDWAFIDHIYLTSVTIPDSVTSIGSGAFSSCGRLTGIFVNKNNTAYNSDSKGVLFNKDQTTLIQAPGGISGSYTIPEGVTTIGWLAFDDCSSLTSVTIPDTVTTIDDAFISCTNLTDIYFLGAQWQWEAICNGQDYEELYDVLVHFAYENAGTCGENVKWRLDHDGVLTIYGSGPMEDAFFRDDMFPQKVVVESGVTTICDNAFRGYSNLTSVIIGDTVQSIGCSAFDGCSSLTSITIPDSVTTIKAGAFWGCEALEEIAFGTGVITIGNHAFVGCRSLTSITIPVGVTEIAHNTFSECSNLTSVTIPNSVTSIGYSAFSACWSLTTVTIPDSVTTIGDSAFLECYRLTDVYYTASKAQWDQISIGTDNEPLTNATLHTVEPVVVTGISIKALPTKTIYLINENLDTTGLVLTAAYSDGSTKTITAGYSVSGFDSSTTGIKTVTVTYEGCTIHFDVFVVGESAVVVDTDSNGYETLAKAIESVDEGSKLTIIKDIVEDVIVNNTVSIDLNGLSVSGTITVADGCTLYAMDSQTDDYTINDGKGYGKLTGTVSGVQAQDGYMMITEEDGVSFHRVNLQLNTMTLRAAEAGIYFKSNFAGDELVAQNVKQFGVALSVQGIPTADNLETDCKYSAFTGFQAGVQDEDTTSTLLKGVMKAENASLINYRNANMPIYGRAYILTNDGQYIFGAAACRTFKQQVEAVDTMWSGLSATQRTSLAEMYEDFTNVMKSWNLPNLKEYIA